MSKILKFEDIEAWKKARELASAIYQISSYGGFASDFGLKNQIRRASVSMMSNIAEGFERNGNKEFSQFLSIAKGSVAEVKSQLYIALDAKFINKQQFDKLYMQADKVERLIGGFKNTFKNRNFEVGNSLEFQTPNSKL